MHATTILQPTPAHFTPIHAEFMRVVLLARCYTAAQPVLDQELLQVDKDRTGCSPRDLLLYHYYAGMVLCGLKKFNLATQVRPRPTPPRAHQRVPTGRIPRSTSPSATRRPPTWCTR